MISKKVSVVVTVLNEEKSIANLLNALLSQTKKADEIIIVDGGSTDSTQDVIQHYSSNLNTFEDIKLLVKNGNRSIGRNYGIEKARNDVIAVTDAGGFPANDWLEKITEPFENKQINIVSGYYKANSKTDFQKAVAPYFLVMEDKVSPNMEFLPSSRSVAFRKNVWEKVPYPEKYKHNEDFVWDQQLKSNGFSFYFKPDAIVFWSPPKTLKAALRQMYRFALGDAEAGIRRPKIKYIYIRYLLGITLGFMGAWKVIFGLIGLYLLWAVQKNFRYAKMVKSFYLLPVIQIGSDLAVMAGHLRGKIKL